jgi:hypothetical protein
MGRDRLEKYLESNPIPNFTQAFGIAKSTLQSKLSWRPNQYAEYLLDECKEELFEYLYAFPGYLEALKNHMVGHTHEWFLNLLINDKWDVNLEAIEFEKPLDYIVEEFFVSESDMEHFSEHSYFKRLKRLIIEDLHEYGDR